MNKSDFYISDELLKKMKYRTFGKYYQAIIFPYCIKIYNNDGRLYGFVYRMLHEKHPIIDLYFIKSLFLEYFIKRNGK